MTRPVRLIALLREAGVKLSVTDAGRLHISGPRGSLTPALFAALYRRRRFLRQLIPGLRQIEIMRQSFGAVIVAVHQTPKASREASIVVDPCPACPPPRSSFAAATRDGALGRPRGDAAADVNALHRAEPVT